MKLLLIAPAAVVLCACSSSDFHPYVGQQQRWPTSPGTFVDSQYEVPVYYGYPPRPYTVLGMMEETSHGRHSNAVDDAAQEAKKLGADAVLMNTGIAAAQDAVLMAEAMKHAVLAGRQAYLAGRMPRKLYATASSPLEGVVR